MKSNIDNIDYYLKELKIGKIQKGYREIISSISKIKNHLENIYTEYLISSIYIGYMDMTYFSFTPKNIRNKKLKISIVYLHEDNRFEVWLCGINKSIKKQYIEAFKNKKIFDYKLSNNEIGVDSILVDVLENNPNFNKQNDLIKNIESKLIKFIDNINTLIK